MATHVFEAHQHQLALTHLFVPAHPLPLPCAACLVLPVQLRPYQRRSLAHMLREERAAATATTPGGSARHLWVKLNLDQHPGEQGRAGPGGRALYRCITPQWLRPWVWVVVVAAGRGRGRREAGRMLPPGWSCQCPLRSQARPALWARPLHPLRNPFPTSSPVPSPLPAPDVHCFVSPILHQIRTSTSKIEAEKWVGANGGAGWIALQVRGFWLPSTATPAVHEWLVGCASRSHLHLGLGWAATRLAPSLPASRLAPSRSSRPPASPPTALCHQTCPCKLPCQPFAAARLPACPPSLPADGHGQDCLRGGRHPAQPAAPGVAQEPGLPERAHAGPPV